MKYYVQCGKLKVVVIAESPEAAARKVLNDNLDKPESERIPYAQTTYVSERGFSDHDDDVVFETVNLIYR